METYKLDQGAVQEFPDLRQAQQRNPLRQVVIVYDRPSLGRSKRSETQIPATNAEPNSPLLYDQYCCYDLPKEGFLPVYRGFYPQQSPSELLLTRNAEACFSSDDAACE